MHFFPKLNSAIKRYFFEKQTPQKAFTCLLERQEVPLTFPSVRACVYGTGRSAERGCR